MRPGRRPARTGDAFAASGPLAHVRCRQRIGDWRRWNRSDNPGRDHMALLKSATNQLSRHSMAVSCADSRTFGPFTVSVTKIGLRLGFYLRGGCLFIRSRKKGVVANRDRHWRSYDAVGCFRDLGFLGSRVRFDGWHLFLPRPIALLSMSASSPMPFVFLFIFSPIGLVLTRQARRQHLRAQHAAAARLRCVLAPGDFDPPHGSWRPRRVLQKAANGLICLEP